MAKKKKQPAQPDTPLFNKLDVQRVLTGIYQGDISPTKLDRKMYLQIAAYLFDGVQQGVGKSLVDADLSAKDERLLRELRESVFIFSGAKTYQQTRLLKDLMFDPITGNRKSFDGFKRDALGVWDEYNVNWLRAEYNTGFGQAQMAAKWDEIQEQKDVLPKLRYETVGDDRVRDEHKALDGITRPVDDPFWDIYMPVNDFNCRCTVIQVTEDEPTTQLGKRELYDHINPIFAVNPGKERVIFTKAHPYFKVEPRHKALAKRNFDLPLPSQITAEDLKILEQAGDVSSVENARIRIEKVRRELPTNPQAAAPGNNGHDIRDIISGKIKDAEGQLILSYTMNGFDGLNRALREGGTLSKTMALYRDKLNTALDTLPPRPGTTWRKVTPRPRDPQAQDVLEEYRRNIGKVKQYKPYLSTSMEKDFVSWAIGDFKNIVYEIEGKTARDISRCTAFSIENEALFKSGTRFKVISVEGNIVKLTEI